jgi:UDP-glucuronate 4-epimerase
MKNILVTGSAGFIGFHLTKALLNLGYKVVGIDNLNDYYDPALKKSRLKKLEDFVNKNDFEEKYNFVKLDIAESSALNAIFANNDIDIVVNLAAQAGVRYSIENPQAYISSNLVGFGNILESCRHFNIKHLIFASSSSVYGMNKKQPFSETDVTDKQVSFYAATKKSNELMAHSYSHLYGIPITGLRFFTVYGPYGRPDMAYFLFAKAIKEGKEILVNNEGEMKRDFTYIDDIVDGILKLLLNVPENSSCKNSDAQAPFRILNIGNNNPVSLMRFIKAIETALGIKAKLSMQPMQAGDVPVTYADISSIDNLVGFKPTTSIEEGILKFVNWYKKES